MSGEYAAAADVARLSPPPLPPVNGQQAVAELTDLASEDVPEAAAVHEFLSTSHDRDDLDPDAVPTVLEASEGRLVVHLALPYGFGLVRYAGRESRGPHPFEHWSYIEADAKVRAIYVEEGFRNVEAAAITEQTVPRQSVADWIYDTLETDAWSVGFCIGHDVDVFEEFTPTDAGRTGRPQQTVRGESP